jgi:hypothetical protein
LPGSFLSLHLAFLFLLQLSLHISSTIKSHFFNQHPSCSMWHQLEAYWADASSPSCIIFWGETSTLPGQAVLATIHLLLALHHFKHHVGACT